MHEACAHVYHLRSHAPCKLHFQVTYTCKHESVTISLCVYCYAKQKQPGALKKAWPSKVRRIKSSYCLALEMAGKNKISVCSQVDW